MHTNEINIRDPYVLVHDGCYYLYGTRSDTCWGKAEGFDCYKSADMEHWEGPVEIFRRPAGFFATESCILHGQAGATEAMRSAPRFLKAGRWMDRGNR